MSACVFIQTNNESNVVYLQPDRMPLNAGDTGYDSVPGPGLSASVGASESSPLLIPEPEPEHAHRWQPLSRVELEMVAGGPGWRKVRCYLVLLFWLSWLALLATSIAIIMMSPRPVAEPLRWWQKTVFYQTDLLMEAQTEGTGDVSGEEKDISDNMNLQCLVMQVSGSSCSHCTTLFNYHLKA